MLLNIFKFFRRLILVCVAVAVALLAWVASSHARVTRIILDPPTALTGQDIPYERIAGRAWGELDLSDPLNALITDIALAPKKANGKVEYIASFFIVKPVDLSKASGVMWHDVPNRGGRITITADLRNLHDVGLSSGWQGDNAGATAVPANAADIPGTPPFGTNEWVKVPVVTGVTGRIFGRIINRSGLGAQPLNVMGNPIPYFPVNAADNSGATLTTHTHEMKRSTALFPWEKPSRTATGNSAAVARLPRRRRSPRCRSGCA